jgi:hypothetical protein
MWDDDDDDNQHSSSSFVVVVVPAVDEFILFLEADYPRLLKRYPPPIIHNVYTPFTLLTGLIFDFVQYRGAEV